jgi:hypothetical protein
MTESPDPRVMAIAQLVAGVFTEMTDTITTQAMDLAADQPRRPDGTIKDPYWRGVVDGVTTVSTGLAKGFREAIQQFEAG